MYTKFIYYDDGIEVQEDSFDNPTLEKIAHHIAKILEQYDEIPDDILKRLDGVETDKFSLFIDDDDDDVLLIVSRYLGEAKVYVDDGEILLEDKRYVYVDDELSGKEIEGVVYNTIKIIRNEFLDYVVKEKDKIIDLLDKQERWKFYFKNDDGPMWYVTHDTFKRGIVNRHDAKIIVEALVEHLVKYDYDPKKLLFDWSFDKNKIRIVLKYYENKVCVCTEYMTFTKFE
ncbi:MAG: hypothetical protein IRZ03_18295 [Acidobacterium ailaaui]|nr:hypothetical protein [Pseudacidobacterium ailaaui]